MTSVNSNSKWPKDRIFLSLSIKVSNFPKDQRAGTLQWVRVNEPVLPGPQNDAIDLRGHGSEQV